MLGFLKDLLERVQLKPYYQCCDLKTTKYGFTSEPEIIQVCLETIIRVCLAALNNGENKHSSFSRNCIMRASYFLLVIVGNR